MTPTGKKNKKLLVTLSPSTSDNNNTLYYHQFMQLHVDNTRAAFHKFNIWHHCKFWEILSLFSTCSPLTDGPDKPQSRHSWHQGLSAWMLPGVFDCNTCQATAKDNHMLQKLQKHLCNCHSDTRRQTVRSLSHYQAFTEAGCQAEAPRRLLQMLHNISMNSQSETRKSARISFREKGKYLCGRHSNRIFDHKSTLLRDVHPSLSAWVMPPERFKQAQSKKLGCVSNFPTPPLTVSV